jgi:hypothetical protein
MLRLFGILSASEIAKQSSDLASKLLKDDSYQWLEGQVIADEVDKHLRLKKIRVNTNTQQQIHKLVTQNLCRRIILECAQAHNASLKSGRLTEQGQFLVHDHMSPWVLIDEHGSELRHPEKDWGFWYSKPHREWVDSVIEANDLIPDLIEQFEGAFSDWIAAGYVRRLSERRFPVRSILYSVKI